MANLETDLSRELSRVLACQYPTSLAKLADILAQTDGRVVRKCIQDRPPCAISKLASTVIDALPLWAYSLQLLEALCHSPDFKDEVLLQSPGLLNVLLIKANSSQRNFDESAQLCVLLLSRPLPEAVPLPASAQTFFLHMFEQATKNSNLTTLRPIYLMLNGACRELLQLISPEDRQTFDANLCSILSSKTTRENPMLTLMCFGIVILSERPHEVGKVRNPIPASGIHTNQNISNHAWQSSSGRKLFGSESGLRKTMNLAYLNVIWATKGGAGVPDFEAVEGIRIATRVMQFIDPTIRYAWSISPDYMAKDSFQHLPRKILRSDISLEVQLEAMCFYAMVAGQARLSKDIVAQFENALCNIGNLQTDPEALRETLSVSLPIFASQLRDSFAQNMLMRILGCNNSHSTHLRTTTGFSVLVEELGAIIPESDRLRGQFLSALSSDPLKKRVLEFLGDHPTVQASEGGCQTYASYTVRRLYTGTLAMLLITALSVSNTESQLSPALIKTLVYQQQSLVLSCMPKCSHAPTVVVPPVVSLFQQECTPSTNTHQQSWQEQIKLQMTMQSVHQQDSVVRNMARICHDLETRCENVEEPLRLERQKVIELTAQVEQANEQIKTLESEGVERRLYIDGLENDINNLEAEKEDLSANLEELQDEFTKANQQATETLHAAQQSFSEKELELRSRIVAQDESLATRKEELDDLYARIRRNDEQSDATEKQLRSTITAHEKNISDQERSIEQLNERTESLQTQLWNKQEEADQQQEVHRSLTEEHQVLESRQQKMEQDLNNERCIVAQQVQELEQLRDSSTILQSRLSSTEAELRTAHDQLSDLQKRHEHLRHSSAQASRDLEHQYNVDMKTARAQHDALTSKVERLTDAVAMKDKELLELKKWKKAVLSSISGPTESPVPNRTRSPIKQSSDVLPTPPDRRRKSHVLVHNQDEARKDKAATQVVSSTALEDVANASFASSNSRGGDGSTPKRAKTHATRGSFKVSAMQKPVLFRSSSVGIAKSLMPTERPALRILSPNRRHTSVSFAISEADEDEHAEDDGKGARRASMQMLENMEFDEYLTSTPFTPGNVISGTGRELNGEFDEESETLEL